MMVIYDDDDNKITGQDAGCWVDNARGFHMPSAIIERAEAFGYDLSKSLREYIVDNSSSQMAGADRDEVIDFYEFINEELDAVDTWMNEHVAPKGYAFGIHPDWGDWGLYKIDSPDEEFRKDWQEFVKGFLPNRFDRYSYENARDGPQGYAKEVVAAIEKGDPFQFIDAIAERSADWVLEQKYAAYQEAVKEFAKRWGDPEDVLRGMRDYPYFQEDFDIIYDERERDNWWILIEGLELLVWNTDMQFSLGWSDFPQDVATELKENPELDKFDRLSGLSKEKFAELVNNGMDMDVQGFIGIIVDAGELIRAMAQGEWTLTWNPMDRMIVALHNGLEGSGYYVESGPTIALDIKKPLRVDFGSYSLGDVYGARDWTWRA
jgi:hypothetical protein